MELWAVLKHRRERVARERQRVLADDVLRHVLEGLLDSRAALLLAVKNLRRRANDRDGAGRSNCAGCIGRADHSALIDAEEGVGDREAARVWLAAVHVEVADKQTPFLSRRHVVHLEVDLDIHVHCRWHRLLYMEWKPGDIPVRKEPRWIKVRAARHRGCIPCTDRQSCGTLDASEGGEEESLQRFHKTKSSQKQERRRPPPTKQQLAKPTRNRRQCKHTHTHTHNSMGRPNTREDCDLSHNPT